MGERVEQDGLVPRGHPLREAWERASANGWGSADDPQVWLAVDGCGFGAVIVNGEDISHAVNEVIVTACVSKPTTSVFGDPATVVQVQVGSPVLAHIADGADVRLRDSDKAALVALGWTPPEEA